MEFVGAEIKAKAKAKENMAIKIFHIPFCAYKVQIFTTSFDFSTSALFGASGSRFIFCLIYSTARPAPVVTACIEAPVNQYITAPPSKKPRIVYGFNRFNISYIENTEGKLRKLNKEELAGLK